MPGDTSDINVNTKGIKQNSFDAIVIGSGISGGWAAKELCELGLKTLVLERGRNVVHNKDYPTANKAPWEFLHANRMTKEFIDANPLITRAAGFGEDTAHFFIKDNDHPYVQEKPFNWVRGYQVGGKSLTWGRACQRWSPFEFTAPERYGYGINFPIGYDDIAPWYSHAEKFIGVCGNKDGVESMPDGEFLPPFDLNCVEQHMQISIKENFNRHMVQGRWAHITQPQDIHIKQGRAQCQSRNLCMRGCPFGGYFSSVSSTIPWAQKTGNLTIRPFSVVHSVIYDEKQDKAIGVRVIDTNTKVATEYFARIIFVNASALNSNLILLHSTSSRFPNGLGNDSGALGKYVMFHNYRAFVSAEIEGFEDKYFFGKNPTETIIANYRNLHKQDTDYVGGFTTFSGAYRSSPNEEKMPETIGGNYKDEMGEPGPWGVYMYLQGETIAKETNHVRLSKDKTDQWGIPQLVTSVGYDDNDDKMVKDFLEQSIAMLEKGGGKNIFQNDSHQPPGLDIHEMGGCRMGKDPKKSLLNEWNQLHHCKNVFVTDGACMTSTGNQSPSILYMALTARAANHAVEEMKKGEFINYHDTIRKAMDRKEAVQYISLLLGGTLVGANSFLSGCKASDKQLFSKEDIAYLDEIAETILPETKTPGAKAAGVGQFMTVMITDCYDEKEKEIFRDGMKKINNQSEAKFGKSYLKITREQRHELLVQIDNEQKKYMKNKKEEEPVHSFRMMKELTLLGYFTSKPGCTQAKRYMPVPGKYIGCVPYKKGEKAIV